MTPMMVVNVKVILDHPGLGQLQVPTIFCPNGNHDPGGSLVSAVGTGQISQASVYFSYTFIFCSV